MLLDSQWELNGGLFWILLEIGEFIGRKFIYSGLNAFNTFDSQAIDRFFNTFNSQAIDRLEVLLMS